MSEKKSTRKKSKKNAAAGKNGEVPDTVAAKGGAGTARLILPLLCLLLLLLSALLLFDWYHSREALPRSLPVEAAVTVPASSREGPLELNRATEEELKLLPGIGDVLARRIVELREERGGFRQLEELQEVSGIGAGKLERIRELIYLEERSDEDTGR